MMSQQEIAGWSAYALFIALLGLLALILILNARKNKKTQK
jgi:hypothetical protein